jgi:predicted permease
MSRLTKTPAWRRYLRFLRPDVNADIDEELRFHFAERMDDLLAAGATPQEARRQTLAEFGDVPSVRDHLRAIDERIFTRRTRLEELMAFGQEVRQALRRLTRAPGFTLPAVLALALGIAAATTVYALLDAVVLSPLPYPHAEQLVSLSSPMPSIKDTWGIARHQLFYYKQNARTLEDLALYRSFDATVTRRGDAQPAERVHLANVSASIFSVLGVRPFVGRTLTPDDNLPEVASVVVLGYEYWMTRFGGDATLVGRTIDVEGFPMQVVGVAAKGASLPDQRIDLWMPDHIDPAMNAINNHTRTAVARLRPGFSALDLERELAPLVLRMEEAFPSAYPNHWIRESGFSTKVTSLRDDVVGETITRALWILFAAVAIVLLIAAANVANLFIVRADARRREVAVRTALGAGRAQLLFHHVSEGIVVALTAGVLAVALAWAALRLISRMAPSGVPRVAEVGFGWTGVVFVLATSLVVGAALGLITLLYSRRDLSALRDGGRGLTLSRQRVAVRGALVVGQVALALVLMAGAALMFRSFQNLRDVKLGFDPTGATTMVIALPAAKYQDYERTSVFYEQLQVRLTAVPGIHGASVSSRIPLIGKEGCTGVVGEASTKSGRPEACVTNLQNAPGYFETIGTAVRGRIPTWADLRQRSGAVVVTKALADLLWPGEEAIGKGIRCCVPGPPYYTVVGVAENVHDAGLDEPPMQGVYFPLVPIEGARSDAGFPLYMHLVIRAPTMTAAALTPIVQRLLTELDPDIPITDPQSMQKVVDRSMAKRTFTLMLLAVAASMALLLSAVGLYGVISYVVGQRRNEIGIRMALGASASDVARMVMRQSLTFVVVGVVIGVGTAVASTRVLRTLLFGVSPTDPLVLVAVSTLLLLLGIVASFAPTRRATKVNPIETLRSA